jgi:NAD-dependent DNA ligase
MNNINMGEKINWKLLIKHVTEDTKKYANKISITNLVKLLKKLSDAYYNKKNSLVPDSVYDELRDILSKRDPKNLYLREIGAPIKGNKKKIKLPFPMGSLDKIKPSDESIKKLEPWIKKHNNKNKNNYILSDKLDGSSVQLYKDNKGDFHLYSRGDGLVGHDISHLLPFILKNVRIDIIPKHSSIRGELIINKKDAIKLKDKMKNARAGVNGLVNSKTVDKEVAEASQYVTYNILHPRYLQEEQLRLLNEFGFKVVNFKVVDKINEKMLTNYLELRRKESEFTIDGIVCIDNSQIYEHEGGNPEYGFAFKTIYDEQMVEAKVVQVIWEESKDRYLKPRIEIEPVELVGTTVTYATAFNAKYIVDNKIGKGSILKIVKSGDVIPYILEVLKPSSSGKPDLPDREYDWNESGVDLVLRGDSNLVKIKIIDHFFSTIGVKYISEGIITNLVNNGYNSIKKILEADREDLYEIKGLGEKIVNKIYDDIDEVLSKVDLPTFMASSNKFGRGLGKKKLQEVIKIYPNIMTSNWTKKEMIDNILEVQGFSDKLATYFSDNFSKFIKFYEEINEIHDISRFMKVIESSETESSSKSDNIFENMTIVFTGFRDKASEDLITSNGGKVTNSVSGKTSLVVRADDEVDSSKIRTAKQLGIKIITRTEFINEYLQ